MTAALAGVRVLDLTRHIPGPYATLLLGALGADVVKVEEPPGGDPVRVVPPAVGNESVVHAALNRNKRSIVVDLRTKGGAGVLRKLAERADVLVEGFRPGVLARRGLGPEETMARNPRLIYCSLTGYGPFGPKASAAGHDINFLALSGFLGGSRGRDGRPVVPTAQVADMSGGLCAALGILAALQARERTGRGQLVDVSLLESTLALMTIPLTRLAAGARELELSGARPWYGVYRCRDARFLAVGTLEPKFWEALVRAIDRPDLAGRQWDPQWKQVRADLERTFEARDRDHWLARLAAADVCVEPVLEPEEVLDHPQSARAAIEEKSAGGDRYRTVALPAHLSDTPLRTTRPAPGLGEHTEEVLAELGLAASEIERLREEGVLA